MPDIECPHLQAYSDTTSPNGGVAIPALREVFTPLSKQLLHSTEQVLASGEKIPLKGRKPVFESYSHPQDLETQIAFPRYAEKFGQYVLSSQRETSLFPLHIKLPVGQYGEQAARDITNTTRALYAIAEKKMRRDFIKTDQRSRDLISRETWQNDTFHTTLEGILTIAQSFTLLAAYQVERFEENPLGLFKAMLDKHIFSLFSLKAHFGLVAKSADSGIVLSSPLLENDGEGVKISEIFEADLAYLKKLYGKTGPKKGSKGWYKGCPLGIALMDDDQSGIDMAAKAFYLVLEKIITMPSTLSPFIETDFSPSEARLAKIKAITQDQQKLS